MMTSRTGGGATDATPPSPPKSAAPAATAGWNRPLQTLLAINIVFLILVVSAALIGLNYYRLRAAAIADAETSMRVFSTRLAERLNTLSNQTTMSLAIIAAVPNAVLALPPERSQDKSAQLREIITQAPFLDGIYAGYPDGSFFHVVNLRIPGWTEALRAPLGAVFGVRVFATGASPNPMETVLFQDASGKQIAETEPAASSFDPRTRPWYKAAAIGRPISLGPYRMATTGKLGMTVAQSHRANGRIVIGADIILDTITDFLGAELITSRTVAFIVDSSGNPVIHSDRDFMKQFERGEPTGAETTNTTLVETVRADDSWSDAARVIDVGAESFLVLATPIRSTSLLAYHRVVVAAPVSELTADSRRVLLQSLLISATVVLGAVLLALFLSRLITRSLHLLTASAERLQSLDFGTPVDVRSHVSEITTLGRSMNRARDAIATFALYVPKEFVRKGVQSGHFSGRSASRQQVTALFTDIYDFTTISEEHSPEQVVAMLSEYFDLFAEAVTIHHGSIIQFLGDSVFAMWNAPIPNEDHAVNACLCALAVEASLSSFNAKQRSLGLPEFRTRFGIHSGTAVVGSVGASERLQYTAMGDTVNVASRLEGINKTFGTTILVSGAVRVLVGDRFDLRALGRGQAKGRTENIELYELVGEAGGKAS